MKAFLILLAILPVLTAFFNNARMVSGNKFSTVSNVNG